MLANQQNPVHGQTVSPQGESFVDRGEYFHPRELLRARPAQIVFRLLIHIERDQVHLGAVMPIPPTVSDQKAIEDVLSMGIAEAASDGKQAVAESLFAASGSFGSAGEATRFLGFALMGASILTQKNLHIALGALMVVIGLIGVGTSIASYTSDFMI